MRKQLAFLAAAAMLAAAAPAFAADMPLKAPPPVPFTSGASGYYWGVGPYAGVAQSNVSGSNLFATSLASSNLTASGGGVSFDLGYLHGSTAALGSELVECSKRNLLPEHRRRYFGARRQRLGCESLVRHC